MNNKRTHTHTRASMDWRMALMESVANAKAVLEEGVLRGHFTTVTRPDGKLGYAITDAGYDALFDDDDDLVLAGGAS